MKEVMAVIRLNMMNKTKAALADAGFYAFFAQEAHGRGKGLVSPEVLKGAAEGYEEAYAILGDKGRLYPKRVVTVMVHDDQVEDVVDVLIKTNKTGKPGDGKIFVMPLADTVRVRTAETGDSAID